MIKKTFFIAGLIALTLLLAGPSLAAECPICRSANVSETSRCTNCGREPSQTANKTVDGGYTFDAEIMSAVDREDTMQIQLLIDKNFDVNRTDKGGRTLLHHALNRDKIVMARFLVAVGVDPNIVSEAKAPLLAAAAFRPAPDRELIRALISKGADVHAATPNGQTVLTGLILRKINDLIPVVIAAGSSVNKKTGGYTPLCTAASCGNVEAARILLDKGADINLASGPQENAPLHFAVSQRPSDLTILLIERGANMNVKNKDGETPLLYAMHRGTTSSQVLAEKGADVNASNLGGVTPLMAAAVYPGEDTAGKLLEFGAKIDAQSASGDTPLHCAARAGSTSVIKLLMSKGADAKAKNKAGQTPADLAKNDETRLMFEGR